MRRHGIGIAILVATLGGPSIPSLVMGQEAQVPSPTERPRIGLTLSGGGAKGFAHLGVLNVLEELRVPVHVLTGTSMGSIMGGLYASGLPPDEIEAVMKEVDWVGVFRDLPPREDLDFRRKEEDQRYLFDIEVGIKGEGLALPSGVLAGQKIALLLREQTLHTAATTDFDELPIPFRAIGADIVTGESVVLGRGDLARSLRASMSIPVGFVPVEIDGHLLVDGGVTNNMPVDIAREMGADVVIAVDVSEPLKEREDLKNMFSIVGQLIGMLTRTNVEAQIPNADILIDPELGELGGNSYLRASEIVAAGEAEARKHEAELRRYSVSEEEYAEYREQYRRRLTLPTRIDSVEVGGENRVDERVILSRLTIEPGDPIDVPRIEKDVARVYGMGDFQQIDWSLRPMDSGHALHVDVVEKPWGPTYLHFGMRFAEDGEFTGLVNVNVTRLNSRGAEWSTDLAFGATAGIETEFYQPVDFRGRFFVAPALGYRSLDQDIFDSAGHRIAEYDVERLGGRLDLGLQLGSYGEWRVGLVGENVDASVGSGAADLPSLDVTLAGLRTKLSLDRLNSPGFPTQGFAWNTTLLLSREGLGSDQKYDRLSMSGAKFWTRGRGTVFGSFEAGSSLGSDVPAYDAFRLGGFLSLSGLADEQLRGRYLGRARLGWFYRIGQLPQILGRGLYVGGWGEAGNVWQERRDVGEDLIYTGTVTLGADTSFGPFYVAYGVTDDGDGEFYISLGQLY